MTETTEIKNVKGFTTIGIINQTTKELENYLAYSHEDAVFCNDGTSLSSKITAINTKIDENTADILTLETEVDAKEPLITTKGTAFNKDFGTTAGTVAEGSHTHDMSAYQTLEDDNIAGTDKNIVNVINSNTNKIDILNTNMVIKKTQAEYDALTTEEKENRLFAITDLSELYSLSLNGSVLSLMKNGVSISSVTLPTSGSVTEQYGQIVLSKTSTTITEGGTDTFTVALSQAPTNDQVVTLTKTNADVTLSATSLTFTSSNYATPQTVTITVAEDNTDYSNEADTITLTSPNVTTKTISITITDNDTAPTSIPVTGITLNKSTSSVNIGSTDILTATIVPSNATNQGVTWSSSDEGIATVVNGVVTGVAKGTTTITCTSIEGNYTATCTVTVTDSQGYDTAYSYLEVDVPTGATTDQATIYLSKPTGGTFSELFINDVSNSIPTGNNQTTNSYTLVEGKSIIKIKGNFTCWNSKCSIKVLNIQNNLNTCSSMFYGCSNISFDTTIPNSVNNCNAMFQSSGITASPSIPTSVTNTSSMFKGSQLVTATTIPSSVTVCDSMYESCTKLQGTVYVSSGATNLTKYINSAGANGTGISLVGIDITKVTNYNLMAYLSKLTTIEQSFADLIKVAKPTLVTSAIFLSGAVPLTTPITLAQVHADWKS